MVELISKKPTFLLRIAHLIGVCWTDYNRRALMGSVLNKFSNKRNSLSVLDVGCGDGCFTKMIPTSLDTETLVGINPGIEKTIGNIHHVAGDAHNLPFPDESFDLIFIKDVLHHVRNPPTVLKEIKRVSKKFVILIESARENKLFNATLEHSWKHYTKSEIVDLINNAGLELKNMKATHSYPWHLVFLPKNLNEILLDIMALFILVISILPKGEKLCLRLLRRRLRPSYYITYLEKK